MQTRLIQSEEELLPLRDSWNTLIKSRQENDVPFFSWDWFYHSWRHFGAPAGYELAVVVAEDGKRLQGVLPLVRGIRKSSGISYRTLEFCNVGTAPRHSAYADGTVVPIAVFTALRDRLFSERKRWDMLELSNVAQTAAFHDFWTVPQTAVPLGLIRLQGFSAPYIERTGTFSDYLGSLAAPTRKDIQRHLKRFKDFGDTKQIRFFDKPEEIGEGLELLFEVHRRSWKGEFINPHYPAFYRDLTPILCDRNEAFIAVALLSGKPISAGYVLTNGDTFFSLINDHDTQHRDLAPGTMLFVYEMDRLIDGGRRRFDFCGTTYDYKERLASHKMEHSTFQIFHGGWKSRFLFSAKTKWLPMLRKLLRKEQPQDVIEIVDEY